MNSNERFNHEIAPPPETNETDFDVLYTAEIKKVVGVDTKVVLVNVEEYSGGDSRFLYGFTESEEGRGFVKMCKVEDAAHPIQEQLRREVEGNKIAAKLGVPTVKVLTSYQETENDFAVARFEAITSEEGTILNSPEEIAGADPKLGRWAAAAMVDNCARQIPEDMDAYILNRGDWRNQSPETFARTWVEAVDLVEPALDPSSAESFMQRLNEAKDGLDEEIAAAEGDANEYLVHNDQAPANTYFNEADESVIWLDWEHAAATHNKVLARNTDMANFYARCWANKEMQQEFAKTVLDRSSDDELESIYKQMRGAMAYGTMFLAKYGVNPNHPEHTMTEKLLQNFEGNDRFIQSVYKERVAKRQR